MQVCGVICEYNPFHNGHAHHLRMLREQTACDYIVCVMSGCFTQRGEAAIFSKWARAEMALRCGADAVFELPTLFAVRDAERFARGGVSLLASLGVVTHLGFGSELGDLSVLTSMEKIEGDLTAIRQGLSQGMTLARARGAALGLSADAPNDTLGVEYLRAIRALGCDMTPVAIRREGSGYHDEALGAFASATAIRAAIRRGEDVLEAMPGPAYALMRRHLDAGAVQEAGGLDAVLLASLRTATPRTLSAVADVSEGLENRLLRAAVEATSRAELIEWVKCKRYTWARLSRVAAQAMLGITKELCTLEALPSYARLLGFRTDAKPLMAAIQSQAAVPIVTRPAKFRTVENPAFALDLRATDIWALGQRAQRFRRGGLDLTQGICIV